MGIPVAVQLEAFRGDLGAPPLVCRAALPGGFLFKRLALDTRQAYVSEYDPEPETDGGIEDEELLPDKGGDAEAVPWTTSWLEGSVENAAEALITMRDARHRLAEVKKDRGFGRASGGSSPASPAQGRGATGRFQEEGHVP